MRRDEASEDGQSFGESERDKSGACRVLLWHTNNTTKYPIPADAHNADACTAHRRTSIPEVIGHAAIPGHSAPRGVIFAPQTLLVVYVID